MTPHRRPIVRLGPVVLTVFATGCSVVGLGADYPEPRYSAMPVTCAQAIDSVRGGLAAFAGPLYDPAVAVRQPEQVGDPEWDSYRDYEQLVCEIDYRTGDPGDGTLTWRQVKLSFDRYETAAQRGTRRADPVGEATERLAGTERVQDNTQHFADLGDGGFAWDSFDRKSAAVMFRLGNMLVMVIPSGADAPGVPLELTARRTAAESIARELAAGLAQR
ncbi:hypothetical protein ACFVMC_11865 [Nocardia sp. NPDC127579]|uniref:hypothetical protein n=1 Tax=Nocardia sp. NPDC127579 TaxID=3345402 RepID=UPI00364025E7